MESVTFRIVRVIALLDPDEQVRYQTGPRTRMVVTHLTVEVDATRVPHPISAIKAEGYRADDRQLKLRQWPVSVSRQPAE